MKSGKVVLGAVAGVAIGALASILFAPEKGSVTRQQIKDKSNDYLDKIKTKFDDLFDSITEKFESNKSDAENLVEKGKAKYDYVKNDAKNATSNFKHNVAADIHHATS
jgi:gas vesicle protein